jgi:endoglucanase
LIAEAHIYGKNGCDTTSCFDSQYAPITVQFPMFWGEVGETYDASDCGSSYVSQFLPWADAHGVGYLAWTWDTWGSCLALVSNYSGTPHSYDSFYQQHLLGLGG